MGGLTAAERQRAAARRPARFTLRAEASTPRSAGRRPLPAGSAPWVPSARLLTLRASAGGMCACRLVLERPGSAWTEEEAAAVVVMIGAFGGTAAPLAVTLRQGSPRPDGSAIQLDLEFVIPLDAAPGRYKAPAEARCGARVEPLAVLLEVTREG